jgi:hypothetical protein
VGEMTDIMVDCETTGVNAHINGMFQLSGIKFNYDTGEVGDSFDGFLSLLPFRQWNEGTRDFWMVKRRDAYAQAVGKMQPGPQVLHNFFNWVTKDGPPQGYRMWAKPITFDFGFLASHMEQVDLPMPFHYRYARDLNTFLAALSGTADHSSVEDIVPFPANGIPHNSLHDAAWQLDQLFYGKRNLSPA